MTNSNNSNLLKYVYGRLYAGTYERNCVKETRRKIYSWLKPLNWLKREGYIAHYKVEVIDKEYSIITYAFNHNKLMYEKYLKAIDRNVQQCIIPTGENVVNANIEEFEQERIAQFKKPIEHIAHEDKVCRKLTLK